MSVLRSIAAWIARWRKSREARRDAREAAFWRRVEHDRGVEAAGRVEAYLRRKARDARATDTNGSASP